MDSPNASSASLSTSPVPLAADRHSCRHERTGDIGSIGDFAASAEVAFRTILQRNYATGALTGRYLCSHCYAKL